jgi:AraC family transcriptional regulator of adaptative response / DNA-3-methyladenine glycosylase II
MRGLHNACMTSESLDQDACYGAISARDVRFDGVFYVGVKTTGVYCRPICPARTPGRARCEFFRRAAEAERAGYRACFRCRPELAPGFAPVDAAARLSQVAAARIEAGYLNEHSIEALAASLGVTARHLRRTMLSELGVTPVELAQTARLALAKRLLQDSSLPLAEIAFASGFKSVRRFNALVQARFDRPPSALRRAQREPSHADAACIVLRLDYRPPLAWDALLEFLRGRAMTRVEVIADGEYRRSVVLGEHAGWLAVRADAKRDALVARIALGLAPKLMEVVARLRALFDLDARPDAIAAHLARDPRLRASVASTPGLRVPGAFDGFEAAVRAVLGQQVSVRGATTLCGRLVERFGTPLANGSIFFEGIDRAFPAPRVLASAALDDVRAIGMPAARAQTVIALARAIDEGQLELASRSDPERTMQALQAIPGIGPWTACYLAMRALRWPDAFPGGDLVVRKALSVTSTKAAEAGVEALRPFRAYAVMHLWRSHMAGG